MILKSITFRCSTAQRTRLESAMRQAPTANNRTALIATALEEFLAFAEQEHIAALDLFELVARIDSTGSQAAFSQQAQR